MRVAADEGQFVGGSHRELARAAVTEFEAAPMTEGSFLTQAGTSVGMRGEPDAAAGELGRGTVGAQVCGRGSCVPVTMFVKLQGFRNAASRGGGEILPPGQ